MRSAFIKTNLPEIKNSLAPQKNLSVPHHVHVDKIKEKETFKTINPS